jgi:hypothetical protein
MAARAFLILESGPGGCGPVQVKANKTRSGIPGSSSNIQHLEAIKTRPVLTDWPGFIHIIMSTINL